MLRAVDKSAALGVTGVEGIWSASELRLPPQVSFGREPALARPLLAEERVRFVGEAVAVVVADTAAHAADGAAAVYPEIEALPPVIGPVDGAAGNAPLLFPSYGTNVVGGRHHEPDPEFFADADVVVRVRMTHHRVAPVPMEPNACLAEPEADGSLTLWASTQSVFGVRDAVASTLGLEPDRVRVRAPWVGGGFGAKGGVYPEQLVVSALAHLLGRPVLWVETRSENLLAMTHGRAQVHDVELGARRDGRFTGLRVKGWSDVGAYPARGMFIPLVTRMMSSGAYAIPKIDFSGVTVVTTTSPTGPYRGAGRPEAAALVERVVDVMADELGVDPASLRRLNFPEPARFPFTTATGATYDSGDYALSMGEALRLVGYEELRAEQRRRRVDPDARLMGIGIACYVETSGRGQEFGAVEVGEDGTVTVISGSVPQGQGHLTAWAQIASAALGVPFDAVSVVCSDTGLVDHGVGTFGSRSLQLAGSAVHEAAIEVLAQARTLAAELLEASPEDIVSLDGRLGVVGVPTSGKAWADLAVEASRRGVPLAHRLDYSSMGSFPSGCHVAVVEIDSDTGQVDLRTIVAVDDCGVVINPMLVEGQVHGGLAQGIGQMLFESVRYDEDGNPLTASLLDYAVPSAADLPSFSTAHTVTPSPSNPLGAKGIGESGTTGSIAAVWNAVIDALEPFGVRHLDGPFAPETVWRAMSPARAIRVH